MMPSNKKHLILTMATPNCYYDGWMLLNTWTRAASAMVLMGRGFNSKLRRSVEKFGVSYHEVSYQDFENRIMLYKLYLIRDMIDECLRTGKYDYISYLDYDTMVVQPWSQIYNLGFDLGITVRPMPREKIFNSNGGVIFVKVSEKMLRLFQYSIELIEIVARAKKSMHGIKGLYCSLVRQLPQYRTVAKLSHVDLTNMRWWLDQLFLSAVCELFYEIHGDEIVSDYRIGDALGCSIGLFNCPKYNDTSEFTLENIKDKAYLRERYIIHFKGKRRTRVYRYMLLDSLYGARNWIKTTQL